MTDTISDESRELLDNLRDDFSACSAGQDVWLICDAETALIKIQSALTAARADERNKALEDAAEYHDNKTIQYADMPDSMMKVFALEVFKMSANAIRAMKVQP